MLVGIQSSLNGTPDFGNSAASFNELPTEVVSENRFDIKCRKLH